MSRWRALMLVLIAAVFAAGALARALPASAAPPPCHDQGSHHGKERPDMLAVSCCLGCLPSPTAADSAAAVAPLAGRSLLVPARATPLSGLTPAPEPYPPRLDA